MGEVYTTDQVNTKVSKSAGLPPTPCLQWQEDFVRKLSADQERSLAWVMRTAITRYAQSDDPAVVAFREANPGLIPMP